MHQSGARPPMLPHNGEHAEWVAGRVETLLSHYFQPDTPAEVETAAIGDWIEMLVSCSPDSISHACASYLRDQPRRRPTPGDIYARAKLHDERPRHGETDNDREGRKVIDWAMKSGRLTFAEAAECVERAKQPGNWAPWLDTVTQRAVAAVRYHPNNRKREDDL